YILMRKNNASYDLAASIYSSNFRSDNHRLSAIDLWSAIEALCGIDSGLRNGIALNVSYFLNHNRSKRLDMYKKIKKMYDKRSSIVHGRKISQEDILLHIQELINILSKVLKKCLDRQILPTTENLFMK
ncbi:MAG: hypothetical protein VX196_06440, partial [Pseudomonadota bacterium]|nr:hypothetical protein [Pseudomonadota bacterium]